MSDTGARSGSGRRGGRGDPRRRGVDHRRVSGRRGRRRDCVRGVGRQRLGRSGVRRHERSLVGGVLGCVAAPRRSRQPDRARRGACTSRRSGDADVARVRRAGADRAVWARACPRRAIGLEPWPGRWGGGRLRRSLVFGGASGRPGLPDRGRRRARLRRPRAISAVSSTSPRKASNWAAATPSPSAWALGALTFFWADGPSNASACLERTGPAAGARRAATVGRRSRSARSWTGPEQLVLGNGLAAGDGVSVWLLAVILISNLPKPSARPPTCVPRANPCRHPRSG